MRKFILGDCMNPKNGLPSLPGNSVDFIISDPPYGIDFQSSMRTEKEKRHKKIANDKSPYIEWIKEAARILKPNGWRMLMFYRWDVARYFIDECRAVGLNVVWEVIWDKVVHGMGDLKAGIAPMHENAIYVTKGRYEFMSRPKSIYRCTRVNGNDMIHPNEKPIRLYSAIFRDFCTPGELIVDPFCGSASSLIACEQMGFDYIGWELDADYYAAAKNRMSKGIQGLIKFDAV